VLGNLDLRASLDFGKLAGTRGLTAFVYWLADHGGDPSAHVGDLQVSSNIETPVNTSRLYEAWVQQLGFDGRVSLLAGLHDLNSEFYVTESSGLFLNSSFGVGKELAQTGVNGPSIFPITAPALRLRVEASPEFYLMTAVFNARAGDPDNPYGTHPRLSAADGRLWITEAGWSPGGFDPGERIGKYAIGAWTYTRAVERVDGGEAAAVNDGAYFLIDQRLGGGVSAFARVGFASTEVNRVGSCLGVGVVAEGLVPGRARDRVGLALARATAGGEFRDAQAAAGAPTLAAETALELDYRVEALPGIALQPSFQRIFDPGLDPAIPDAWTGALRVELSF
jgi:porin